MDLIPIARYLHRPKSDRFWSGLAEGLCRYFRTEVDGLENLPKEKPLIVVANHSGFAGADAIVLAHWIHSRLGREAQILAHPYFFELSRAIRLFSLGFNLRKASYRSGIRSLKDGKVLILFPEGEKGNFKSSLKRYRLQPFHTGFVRMAVSARAAVVPCLITGAEESHWNLGSIGLGFLHPRLRLPIPLNWIPFPAKWRIRFLPPRFMEAPGTKRGVHREWIHQCALETQDEMQKGLNLEIQKRDYIFLASKKDKFPRYRRGMLRSGLQKNVLGLF